LALIVVGVSALTFTNTTNSLVQLSTEPSMRGRVMAIRLAIALGCTPIGAPIIGFVADAFGPDDGCRAGGQACATRQQAGVLVVDRLVVRLLEPVRL
jgi:hypothetical protein